MFRKPLLYISILLAILVSSCFKEDERITPHVAGQYITDTVALTDTYKYQVYYSLLDSNKVSSNLKTKWDLGFESTLLGWRVVLNSSNFMKSAYLPGQDFGLLVDTIGVKWIFNPSDGSADSLTIGKWFEIGSKNDTLGTNRLLLIDRGIDERGDPRGYSQLVIDSLKNGIYYFRTAAMDGKNPKSYSIKKQENVNNVLFSISNPSEIVSEPDNSNWDLLFTQYTTLLYTDEGDPYPYLLTGVLLNPRFVEVAVDSLSPFESVTYETAQSMNFSKSADRIGYNWKRYDFAVGTYTVNSDIVYVIRDTKGFLYKLRFIGFYKLVNNKMEKGFPSFEYQKL
ncbi:MAG: HmuY family protein [Bacteroidales bacterium]